MTEDKSWNAGIRYMNLQLKTLLPDTYYAYLPTLDRVRVLIGAWQRAITVNQELEAENERLRLEILRHEKEDA